MFGWARVCSLILCLCLIRFQKRFADCIVDVGRAKSSQLYVQTIAYHIALHSISYFSDNSSVFIYSSRLVRFLRFYLKKNNRKQIPVKIHMHIALTIFALFIFQRKSIRFFSIFFCVEPSSSSTCARYSMFICGYHTYL